ncbi:MAG: hypothetical protein A2Z25_18460 [Planctomycetes bacterium RBG_16_55_9]|nr:MAG: hypothetical protein A2Z25_18460 [Planctomycetes bacterium RBG_16_55_9]
MKKVAIFTEGQSEQIFVRHFLEEKIGWERISFRCLKLYSNTLFDVPFSHCSSNADVYFLLINVGNDEKVLSAIREREEELIKKGYEKIIALRDMYSESYCRRSTRQISDSITENFLSHWRSTIQTMSEPSKISIQVAIMELEAWFLGMYSIFEKIDSKLNIGYIQSELGFNLRSVDPQKEFFHPSDTLNSIFRLIGSQYRKSKGEVENICSKIKSTDYCTTFMDGRCSSFKEFYQELLTLAQKT